MQAFWNFWAYHGMLVYFLLALLPVGWAVIAQIRHNQRRARNRIARDFGIEARSAEARQLKRMGY
jgi:hypothetical protein